jgi:hypothetical protein
MLSENLILPYAPLDIGRKLPFSAEMEIAAVVCSAEAKRKKKSGILGGKPEKIVSIAKLYHPLWLVPWENEYVTIDGMRLFSFEMVYGKLPDCDSFIESVGRSQKSYDQFVGLLQQNTKTFKDFVASQRTLLEGVIQNKELQSALLEYYRTESPFKEQQVNENAFLKERLDKKTALAKINEIASLWKQNQSDATALQGVMSTLEDTVETVSAELYRNIEDIKREYEDKISQLRPVVEEKVRQLTDERDTKIKTVMDTTAGEVEARTKEKDTFQTQLESLMQEKTEFEERKELAKLRKDEERVKRWKFSLREREKRIAELSKKIRKLQEQIDHANKEKEKILKQTNETYHAQINAENSKIPSLEASRDTKIAEIQENIKRMRSQVDGIKRQIGRLLEEKSTFAARLKEIATAWKLETVVLLLLPFYVVDYLSESKERYEFYAPVMASSPEGILKAIKRKFWGFSIDARMGVLLRQRSKALDKMLSSTLSKRLETDRELHNIMREKMQQNNLLLASGFKETLTKGLDSLVTEEWVKPEERDMILQKFAK